MIELFKKDITKVNSFVYPTRCFDRYGKFLYKKSYTCPVEYIVTDELQKIASEYQKKMEEECLSQIKDGDLVLLRMGGDFYEKRDLENSDLENHRLRLSFDDKNGVHVVGDINSYHLPKSKRYSNDIQDKPIMYFDLQHDEEDACYLYRSREICGLNLEYTKENLLKIINKFSKIQYDRVFICNECVSYEAFEKITNY